MDNKAQFSGKAQFYNSRPIYPQKCIDYLCDKLCLKINSVIADIGAGTGILTKPFLDLGCSVYAVEPNEDMFQALTQNLSHYQNAKLLNFSAEETNIPATSCDAVVVGTAFHWFDKDEFYKECRRILKNNKYVAILRISNNTQADKQIDKIKHYSDQDLNEAKEFFGDGFLEHISFEYFQSFNEERYINNLLSSATAPLPGDANYDECVNKYKSVFNKHFENGYAELPYIVNCYIGRLNT
ncbi:MAG TPA: hypothetical protein DDW30_02380 [Clostridiales bacterium]|nr:hypothetical protein [Clostridiales bacterium]